MTKKFEYDPIEPFIYNEAEVLILGSFPAPKARETGFYYAHPSNRFWKVMAEIFNTNFPETIEERKSLMKKNKIALWNVCNACSIEGSKDSSITDVIPNDLASALKNTNIKTIFTSGRAAEKLYHQFCYDSVGIDDIYLPSTSAVNRQNFSFERLVNEYKQILEYL